MGEWIRVEIEIREIYKTVIIFCHLLVDNENCMFQFDSCRTLATHLSHISSLSSYF